MSIARAPTQHPNDETCSICHDERKPVVIVIWGGYNCGVCGNQVNLCAAHYAQFKLEMFALENRPE